MACHKANSDLPYIFCCNSTISMGAHCDVDSSHPPICPPRTFECAYMLGGGCCPVGTQCSPNGCIEFEGNGTPRPITSTYLTTVSPAIMSGSVKASKSHGSGQSATKIDTAIVITTITIVVGGPMMPTATILKYGPVAQRGRGFHNAKIGWWQETFSHSILGMLVVVALGMLLL
jgi:hypothetical protein